MTLAAVDIETYDPLLKKLGPGSRRGLGEIIGIGIHCPEWGISGFYKPDDKLANSALADPEIAKVFHNGVYDLDWLDATGHKVEGRIEDTMTRETLLDAYQDHYDLDSCCERHGVLGKNKEDTIEKYYSGKGKAVEHLKEIPWDIVGRYCVQDCIATYNLYYAQEPEIEQQGLQFANDIESALYPWLMACRRNGLIIDNTARALLSDTLNEKLDRLKAQFYNKYGDVNLNSATQLAEVWKKEGLPIAYTESGRPSFTSAILEDCTAPVGLLVKEIRMLEKLLGTFIDGQFVDLAYHGRLWPVMYPSKRDVGGTVTGRFSSANINCQNIPAREDKYGTEVRSLFIPEQGMKLGAFDYKQIEYRLFVHFAVAAGVPHSEALKKTFHDNPNTDYHQMTQDLMGWTDMGKAGRHITKNLNFGSLYGLGPKSFAERFKHPLLKSHPDANPDNLVPLATSLMDQYWEKVPFARPTLDLIQNTAVRRGYVKTLSGRRQRLPPDNKVYKLVNYLIQGSAADLFKKAMVDAWNKGIFKILVPHIMVHDELVFSYPDTPEGRNARDQLAECMCNAYRLTIPLGVDKEVGPDWGHCKEE